MPKYTSRRRSVTFDNVRNSYFAAKISSDGCGEVIHFHPQVRDQEGDGTIISRRTADDLGLDVGDSFIVNLVDRDDQGEYRHPVTLVVERIIEALPKVSFISPAAIEMFQHFSMEKYPLGPVLDLKALDPSACFRPIPVEQSK